MARAGAAAGCSDVFVGSGSFTSRSDAPRFAPRPGEERRQEEEEGKADSRPSSVRGLESREETWLRLSTGLGRWLAGGAVRPRWALRGSRSRAGRGHLGSAGPDTGRVFTGHLPLSLTRTRLWAECACVSETRS